MGPEENHVSRAASVSMTDKPAARLVWSIGSPDGRSAELVDTYRQPNLLGDVVWRAPGPGAVREKQAWPLFHPSEADPVAGYRAHPYTVEFPIEEETGSAYLLCIRYLVIAPRLAHLEIEVNGIRGLAYLRPVPSRSGAIRVPAGLHTSIYSEGTVEVVIPGVLLHRGTNRLTLIARDGGEIVRVENAERINRLDRMANGAGFLYQHLAFSQLDLETESPLARCEMKSSPLYRRGKDGRLWEQCHLYLELNRGGVVGLQLDLECDGRAERRTLSRRDIPFGHLRVPCEAPDGDGPIQYTLRGQIDGQEIEASGSCARYRKWQVFVTPHAHTDIGYTHRQWEVAERLCRNIDRALDLLDDPDRAPSFAYHLDSSWALDHYLATRDERRRRQMMGAVRAGRIGVPSAYVDLLTQFAALEDLIRNGEPTESLLRPEGLRADFTTVVDVASLTGALPAILQGSGVRYLVHANNQDRGPFRLYGELHRSSPYYWDGPTEGGAGRVLVWLSKMYCELRKVCGSPPVPDAAERGLQMWLDDYERPDYAPDAVMLYSQEADNTDLDPQPADFVRRWNEMYAYPRLIPSVVGDFFRYVEGRFGGSFTTIRGDGGAYWEDGVGSHIRSTASVREAQAALPAAETLESLAVMHGDGLTYPLAQFDAAWRQILLFDEHTWGAFLSGGDPDSLLQRDQWSIKEHMARDAQQWSGRLLHGAAVRHSLSWNTDGREVVVYNPHNWSWSGPVSVEIGRHETVVDARTDEALAVRHLRTTETQAEIELWVDDLPGLSYRRFRVAAAGVRAQGGERPAAGTDLTLENAHYCLVVQPERGCAVSWIDRSLDRELVDRNDRYGLGQFLHATGGEGTTLTGNHGGLPPGNPEIRSRFDLADHEVERYGHGQRVALRGKVAGGTLEIEWVLPHRANHVDVRYTYYKEERLSKEAVYVAFPLHAPTAHVLSDSQLGWVDWTEDGLPGACKEWLPLQTGMLVHGEEADILICSPDIPLFCVGDVVRGRWPKEMDLTGGHLFSYVLNNYWHTNYRASQGGAITFRYRLTSGRSVEKDRAYRMGWDVRRPTYAHRIGLQEFRHPRGPYSSREGGTLAHISPQAVALSTLKKARWGDGFVLRLQEIAGRTQRASVSFPHLRVIAAWECDLLERDLIGGASRAAPTIEADGTLRVNVPAWGLTTVRIVTAEKDRVSSL